MYIAIIFINLEKFILFLCKAFSSRNKRTDNDLLQLLSAIYESVL